MVRVDGEDNNGESNETALTIQLRTSGGEIFDFQDLSVLDAIQDMGGEQSEMVSLASAYEIRSFLDTLVLALALVGSFGVLGLGAAFAIAYVISALWVLQILSYKVPGFELRPILWSLWRMIVAGTLMGEAVWFVARNVGGNVGVDALIRLIVGATVGVIVYFGLLTAMGAPELDALRRRLARRSPRAPTGADG